MTQSSLLFFFLVGQFVSCFSLFISYAYFNNKQSSTLIFLKKRIYLNQPSHQEISLAYQ